MERAIHISSIKREKTGENRPDNFLIKFNPSLKLNPEKKHFLAIDRLTMTYSWYNIRGSYNSYTIKYSNDRGRNCNTVTFKDGMYSYLISMIIFINTWRDKIIIQLIKVEVKNFTSISVSFFILI